MRRPEKFCGSVQALARGDSPTATASPTQRWLLIEQPGPWGRDALTESRVDPQVAGELARRSRAEGVRLLLVRRPGDRLADSGRRWAYADSKAMDEFLALAYAHERGLNCVIARLFNTVGPRQTGRYGMVLPSFVRAALAGGTKVRREPAGYREVV